MTLTITSTETRTGFGQTRKTRKSAEREALNWNESGDGSRYLWNDPSTTFYRPTQPTYFESVVAEVQTVEGGYACAYVTTREHVSTDTAV